MTIIIRSDIIRRWLGDRNPFVAVSAIRGEVVRFKEGRTTQRFEIDGTGFYAKYHEGVGWLEIIKNLVRLRWPILGASNEWQAINRLAELNVDTLTGVAYGVSGVNPASRQSFLITSEITDVISLEDLVKRWPQQAPGFVFKKALIEKVAEMTGIMHRGGINHRDLYICHFLLRLSRQGDVPAAASVRLFLIDLHRAQCRSAVPYRWLVKDIGSLYFSILRAGFTRRDIYRFLREYFQQPLRQVLTEHAALLQASKARALNLYRRDFDDKPAPPC